MSFAQETKAALCVLSDTVKHDCCKRAELYGILYAAGIFTRARCKLVTVSEELARLAVKKLSDLYGIGANLYITEKKSGDDDERRSCKITVVHRPDLEKLFKGFRYDPSSEEDTVSEGVFKCSNCMQAFLRGVFLTAGTVVDPEKGYQLEMSFSSAGKADAIAMMLSGASLEPKRMQRKTESVLYFKDNDSIAGFLAFIGANNAAFYVMNKKIEKEFRSDANRIRNGELANIGKTVTASGGHISAIKMLRDIGMYDSLPDELKITAALRLDNPEATLLQLAQMHEPPITKSGVNHRLKKILECAEELKNSSGI